MLAEPPCVILLYRAIKTLGVLPDPDERFFRITTAWPNYPHQFMDAYNPDDETEVVFRPTPQDVSTYLDILNWQKGLSKLQRWIMWLRAEYDYSLPLIADYLRMPISTIEVHHAEAVNIIARASWLDRNKPHLVRAA